MPTYDYECQKCGHIFEAFHSMNAEPLKQCPECKGKVRKLLGTGAGIIFKGSGFYQTDYRSEGYKWAEKADKAPVEKSTSSSSDSSGDKSSPSEKSKPAEKKASPAPASATASKSTRKSKSKKST